MFRWSKYVKVYASYEFTIMNSVRRINSIHKLHILGICPSTSMPVTYTCMFQCSAVVVFTQTPHQYKNNSKIRKSTFSHHDIAMYMQATNMPFMYHIYATMQIFHMQLRQVCQNICLIWTHYNQQCDKEHWYTHFTLLAHATNMPAIFQMYVPLFCCCSVWKTPISAHWTQKKKKENIAST